MALSLDDIIAAPTDPDLLNQHLQGLGLLKRPEEQLPAIAPAQVGPLSRVTTPTDVAPMSPVTQPAPITMGGTPAMGTPPIVPPHAAGISSEISGLPGGVEAGGAISPTSVATMTPPRAPTRKESIEAGKEEFRTNRPTVTAAPGTSEFWQQKLAQDEYDRNHPWGSDVSAHPGLLGKIGHYAGLVGQLAGGVINPGLMEQIPGSRMNRQAREAGETAELEKTRAGETASALEKTKEKHEENVESDLQIKLQNAQDKIDNEHQKTLNTRELGLRKQGLKPDPANPNGPPIPVTRADMSETEQAVTDLKQAQTGAAEAKAELDRIKADPNSPQNKATFQRIQIMAKNAATNAGKLGLDQKKYLADYFGLDENLQPLAGVQMTPEGKPVGPKIAGSAQKALSEFNHNYEKPANDVETGYQKFQDAYKDYKAGAKTGAASMVALSQHLATTFGSVKGARLNKDLIAEHKDAIGAIDRMQRFGEMIASGQQLSDDQWKEFGKLIANTRKLAWQTSVKEAKRANLPINFLPEDLGKELNPQGGKGGGGGGPKAPPKVGDIVNGHRFLGGNPNDQKSWEAVKTP